MSKQAVSFYSKDNKRLFGVCHEPEKSSDHKTGVVFIVPGIKNRVAPHRMYVKLAEAISGFDLPVLRFDPHGMGDSEGEVEEERAEEFFLSIQTGRYTEDTISAMDWLKEQYGCTEFILVGLCGGAVTALFAAEKDNRVRGVVGFGIPALFERGRKEYFKVMSSKALDYHYQGYIRKVLSPKAWLRVLTFQSSYKVILKSFANRLFPKKQVKNGPDKENKADPNLNYLVMPAINALVGNEGRMLLMFGENDRLYWEFGEKLHDPNQEYFEQHKSNINIHVVEKANHIFSTREWQSRVFGLTHDWIKENYAA